MMSFLSALPGAAAQGIIWGIMAIGVYITFRVLDIADLTVDGSFGTGGAVLVMCTISGMNIYLAMLLAFLAGCLAGLATGIFHTVFGIPAILAGILTQLALYSINLRILGGKANQTVSARNYKLIVSLGEINKSLIVGLVFSVVIIAILYWFFGTELGHSIRATGNNQAMARANGINTNINKIIVLLLSNGQGRNRYRPCGCYYRRGCARQNLQEFCAQAFCVCCGRYHLLYRYHYCASPRS